MRRWSLVVLAAIGIATLWAMRPPHIPSRTENLPPQTPEAPPLASVPPLTANDPVRGDARAPITIVEVADFACPACAQASDVLTSIAARQPDRVRVIWKDLPLLDRLTGSRTLHVAARCAQRLGGNSAFWSYHDALFHTHPRTESALTALATNLGISESAFRACLQGTDTASAAAMVDANTTAATRAHITATPTFFVNGILVGDPPTRETFERLIAAPPPPR
jgi:protein-disulfide isomerase